MNFTRIGARFFTNRRKGLSRRSSLYELSRPSVSQNNIPIHYKYNFDQLVSNVPLKVCRFQHSAIDQANFKIECLIREIENIMRVIFELVARHARKQCIDTSNCCLLRSLFALLLHRVRLFNIVLFMYHFGNISPLSSL